MKISIIGGTGLLGLAGAKELIKRGHEVKSIALPPIPEGVHIPSNMKLTFENYMEMTDDDLRDFLNGSEGFIFAAGIDERVEVKKGESSYEMFKKYNNLPLERIMSIAKECNVKNAVILGSYFSYFAKEWKSLELTKYHPYIRSRIEQEEIALRFAENGKMNVAILELPYIFGTQKGRKPVWLFISEMIKNTKGNNLFYPKGGTTMVTVKQVGQAIAGAMENNTYGNTYPVGWFNMSWKKLLEIFAQGMEYDKKIITIPTFLYRMNAKKMANDYKKNNIDTGLDMLEYVKVMTANTFIDKGIIETKLGVTDDNIEQAIKQSAKLCKDILDEKIDVIDMKAE